MSLTEFFLQPVWQRVAFTLVHFLWQGLCIVVVLAVVLKICKVRRSRERYGAFLIGLLAMAACPVITFLALDMHVNRAESLESSSASHEEVQHPVDGEAGDDLQPAMLVGTARRESPPVNTDEGATVASAPAQRGEQFARFTRTIGPWIVILWAGGVFVLSVRLLVAFTNLSRLRRGAVSLPIVLTTRVDQICALLRMRPPRVLVSPDVPEAAAAGFLRPFVLLPVSWLMQLSPDMLEAVLAHELAHIRRHDLWVNLFQRLLETLFFYHPAVWWLSKRLRTEREMCCDELAVAATGTPDIYAETLEFVARTRQAGVGPLLAAGFGTGDKKMILLNRVRNVLGLERGTQCGGRWTAGLLALSVLTAICLTTSGGSPPDIDETTLSSNNVAADKAKPDRVGSLYVRGFAYRKDKAFALWIVKIDPKTGTWTKLIDAGTSVDKLRVSPDGQTIAYDLNGAIWTADTQTAASPGKISDKTTSPIWSGDGKSIIATSVKKVKGEKSGYAWTTWWFSETGANRRPLDLPSQVYAEDWSPDGKWLIRGGQKGLRMISFDGKKKRHLAKAIGWFPRFSPDGKQIAFIPHLLHRKLKVTDLEGKNIRTFFEAKNAVCPRGNIWSRSGKQIATVLQDVEIDATNGKKGYAAPTEQTRPRIAIIDVKTGKHRILKLPVVNGVRFYPGGVWDWR